MITLRIKDTKKKHTHYTLIINLHWEPGIYRVIQIDGERTLDYLSKIILKSLNFEEDHLYLFNMERKRFGENSYYSRYAQERRLAARVKIKDLKLRVRKKFLFLFDFGYEWLFDITVANVKNQTGLPKKSYVLESVGAATQYGEYDEASDEYYYWKVIITDKKVADILKVQEKEMLQECLKMLAMTETSNVDVSNTYDKDSNAVSISVYLLEHKEVLLNLFTKESLEVLNKLLHGDLACMQKQSLNNMRMLNTFGLLEILEENREINIYIPKEVSTQFKEYLGGMCKDIEARDKGIHENVDINLTNVDTKESNREENNQEESRQVESNQEEGNPEEGNQKESNQRENHQEDNNHTME